MRRSTRSRPAYAEIVDLGGGAVAYRSSCSAGLVAALKARIPNSARRWEPDKKQWIVEWRHIQTLKEITEDNLGILPDMQTPNIVDYRPKTQTIQRLIKLEYLGIPKRRDSGEETSYGFVDGGWNVIIAAKILKAWFDPAFKEDNPRAARTLYGVLSCKPDATEREIKLAYRKLAKRLHPDVNKEPDANQQFGRVNEAYHVLKDAKMRKRYDAGLQFEATIGKTEYRELNDPLWRPPLRCGYLLVEGKESLGRMIVSKIIQWEDIVNNRGQIAVASWPTGGSQFIVNWV